MPELPDVTVYVERPAQHCVGQVLRRQFEATREVLNEWTARLRDEADRAGGWPDEVTALHTRMAVHGRYGQPCPV